MRSRPQARAEAAQSRVTDSSTLLKLAKDKHDAGTATGVDVLRAQVQLANDKQALLDAPRTSTSSRCWSWRATWA